MVWKRRKGKADFKHTQEKMHFIVLNVAEIGSSLCTPIHSVNFTLLFGYLSLSHTNKTEQELCFWFPHIFCYNFWPSMVLHIIFMFINFTFGWFSTKTRRIHRCWFSLCFKHTKIGQQKVVFFEYRHFETFSRWLGEWKRWFSDKNWLKWFRRR